MKPISDDQLTMPTMALSTLWVTWSYLIIDSNKVDASWLYWIFTAAIAGWYIFVFLPASAKEAEKQAKKDKEEYDRKIDIEVQKRLRLIREQEWAAKQKEKEAQEAKDREERKRKEQEDKWRKEFEAKLEAKYRPTQISATDVTNKAFGDFV